MVPTWTGKPGKIRKLFPVKEKSGNFEQTVKYNLIILYDPSQSDRSHGSLHFSMYKLT